MGQKEFTMRPNNFLVANVKDGVVCLSSKGNETSVIFLGSSLSNFQTRSGEWITDLYIPMIKGESHVIALKFNWSIKGVYENAAQLIAVKWDEADSKPKVLLEEVYIPKIDRLVSLSVRGKFTFAIGDQNFCSPESSKLIREADHYHVVKDINMVLRWIAGHISDDDLLSTAEKVKAEKSAREQLPVVKRDLEICKTDLEIVELKEAVLNSRVLQQDDLITNLLHTYEEFLSLRPIWGGKTFTVLAAALREKAKFCIDDIRQYTVYF